MTQGLGFETWYSRVHSETCGRTVAFSTVSRCLEVWSHHWSHASRHQYWCQGAPISMKHGLHLLVCDVAFLFDLLTSKIQANCWYHFFRFGLLRHCLFEARMNKHSSLLFPTAALPENSGSYIINEFLFLRNTHIHCWRTRASGVIQHFVIQDSFESH